MKWLKWWAVTAFFVGVAGSALNLPIWITLICVVVASGLVGAAEDNYAAQQESTRGADNVADDVCDRVVVIHRDDDSVRDTRVDRVPSDSRALARKARRDEGDY